MEKNKYYRFNIVSQYQPGILKIYGCLWKWLEIVN